MRLRHRAAVLVALAGIGIPAGGQAGDIINLIVGFGDSITAGWPYLQVPGNGCRCPAQGYPAQLASRLSSVDVLNYGDPGEWSSDGVNRIDGVLAATRPDVILIDEGTNDALWSSPGTIATNLAIMMDKASAYEARSIVGTLLPDYRYPKPITAINSAIKSVAADRAVVVADHYSATVGNWEALNTDGLHPNETGYAVMAQTWDNALAVTPPEPPEPPKPPKPPKPPMPKNDDEEKVLLLLQ